MKALDSRFSRNLGFMSEAEQQRLIDSTVSIAGAGGGGGMLAVQLARMGIGEIRLADPETFDVENINRQACATMDSIGENKAEAVSKYLNSINPEINLKVYPEGVSQENVDEFISGSNLLIDEAEFTLHAIGVMMARKARAQNIPGLMAINIGFGMEVTTFHPNGKTYESVLGLSETATIEELEATEVPIERWLPYVPPYGDMDVLKAVASGEKSAPSIGIGVNIASAVGASQAFLNLVQDIGNNRPKPVYAPKFLAMDALTGESKLIRYPRMATKIQLARMALNNVLNRNPSTNYA